MLNPSAARSLLVLLTPHGLMALGAGLVAAGAGLGAALSVGCGLVVLGLTTWVDTREGGS